MAEIRPPIPVRLAHRPTAGGLVAPWINVVLADGSVDFRQINGSSWRKAWTEDRCQTCEEPHGPLRVFLGGPNQIKPGGYFDEPPLHPECAAYATKACPMVAGRMSRYREHLALTEGPRGKACPTPSCDCGGYQATEQILRDDGSYTIQTATERASSAGEPAHPWYAVTARSQQLAVTPEGRLLGGVPVDLVRTREISTPGSS